MADGKSWQGWYLFDEGARDKLYERCHELREKDPVNETPLGLWRLTRHRDCMRLLREVKAGMRSTTGDSYSPRMTEQARHGRASFMLFQDPPTHTRLRKLVSHAFTPRAIERWRPEVERIANACLDAVADRDEIDVIADLALPVPSTVICEMLGVPLEDRDTFTIWTAEATHALTPNPLPDPVVMERAENAASALAEYFDRLIAQRRGQLGDDLMSLLIRAEEDGDRLSQVELVSQTIGLLIAGFETTIGLIGNGVRALALHPGELAKLRARPELITSAVEECLRWDGPISAAVRVLHEDCEFGGKTIPANTPVLAILAAANRDPEAFPDPDRFDVERTPNEHLAFGGGVHFCLGAHLARMEGQVAIGALVRRYERLELVSDKVEWGRSLFRVPATLPLKTGDNPFFPNHESLKRTAVR
jgi:cytochrome P450